MRVCVPVHSVPARSHAVRRRRRRSSGRIAWAVRAERLLLAAGAMLLAAARLPAQTPVGIAQVVDPARIAVLAAHHPLWANAANDAGAAPADLQLNQVTLVLARSPQQERAFEQLLADQQNPASPQYHRWLTAAEVGRRFGVAAQDLAAIRAWVDSQGLRVVWTAPGGNFIGIGGSAADFGRAFHTELHYYTVKGERRLSVASDPGIPQALAPVIKAVRGLYDIQDRPAHFAQMLHSKPQFSNGGNHYIAPGDFAAIYDLPSNLSGAGVTIGVVGWSFVDSADIDNFRRQTGLDFADPAEVVPTGFGGVDPGAPYTAPPAPCGNCLIGQEEATLDVMRAAGVAPDAGVLLVASSKSGANDGIGAAAQYLIQTTPPPAQIIDISFGDCEADAGPSGVAYWNQLFEQAAAEGISVFVSSGDSGAAGCDTAFAAPPGSPGGVSPNYICSSPYATCVGGTDFNDAADAENYWSSTSRAGLASALGYIPEGGWNEPLNSSSKLQVAASSGGVSRYIAMPAWQRGISGIPAADAGRYTPDVSFSASCREGYFGCLAADGGSCVSDENGSFNFVTFCGTSTAAPAMAGIAALLDQQMGGAPQGSLNAKLYGLQSGAPSVFHDVTIASSGVSNCALSVPSLCNNSVPAAAGLSVEPGYPVGVGYDQVTGLGSLDVRAFLATAAPSGSIANATQSPAFTLSGAALSLVRGASTGNSSTITITPTAGFTGEVALTAKIAAGPAGARNPPTISFSSGGRVRIGDAHAVTAVMTVSTVGDGSSAMAQLPATRWYGTGGVAMACLLLFGIPRRRGRFGLFSALALLVVLTTGISGCTAGIGGTAAASQTISGTTPGSYTITVTGTSGSTVATTPITLIVQ